MTRLLAVLLALGLSTSVYASTSSSDGSTVTTATTATSTTSTDDDDATAYSILQAAQSTWTASAAASVVSIFFPGADQLPYVASLIGQANGVRTLAVTCAPGVSDDTCGFPSSITVTAGPSTAYVSVSNQEATFIYDCKISASTTAVCAETFQGDIGYIATKSSSGATGSTTSVVTESLAATDITWLPVTITAGLGATGSNDGGAYWSNINNSGTASTGTATSTATGTATGTTSSTATGTGSTSTATGSQTTTSGTTGTGTTSTATTKTGIWPMTYTGAASKVGAYGNLAAGLLAFIGMAL